jgi:hypothetical protein
VAGGARVPVQVLEVGLGGGGAERAEQVDVLDVQVLEIRAEGALQCLLVGDELRQGACVSRWWMRPAKTFSFVGMKTTTSRGPLSRQRSAMRARDVRITASPASMRGSR